MTARKCQKILKFEIKLFWRAAGFLLLFLMPLFSYIIFETILLLIKAPVQYGRRLFPSILQLFYYLRKIVVQIGT